MPGSVTEVITVKPVPAEVNANAKSFSNIELQAQKAQWVSSRAANVAATFEKRLKNAEQTAGAETRELELAFNEATKKAKDARKAEALERARANEAKELLLVAIKKSFANAMMTATQASAGQISTHSDQVSGGQQGGETGQSNNGGGQQPTGQPGGTGGGAGGDPPNNGQNVPPGVTPITLAQLDQVLQELEAAILQAVTRLATVLEQTGLGLYDSQLQAIAQIGAERVASAGVNANVEPTVPAAHDEDSLLLDEPLFDEGMLSSLDKQVEMERAAEQTYQETFALLENALTIQATINTFINTGGDVMTRFNRLAHMIIPSLSTSVPILRASVLASGTTGTAVRDSAAELAALSEQFETIRIHAAYLL